MPGEACFQQSTTDLYALEERRKFVRGVPTRLLAVRSIQLFKLISCEMSQDRFRPSRTQCATKPRPFSVPPTTTVFPSKEPVDAARQKGPHLLKSPG